MTEKTIPDFNPAAIAASGQCFRMRPASPDMIDVVAFRKHLRIECLGGENYRFSCGESEFQSVWAPYFDLDTDYNAIAGLCDSEDACLADAVQYGRGLRILRQEPWETLISFIISQRKNIPAITKAVESLCLAFGEPIADEYGTWHAFPTPESILKAREGALESCRLGYREKYIVAAARAVREGMLDFAQMEQLSDEQLYRQLISLYGVGEKVAGCVMLFGFHRLAACPVDVWISRIIQGIYHGDSPFAKYPGYAGVMQQYLFNYRNQLKDL
jgi:N-glycosylase/DNA lyase